MSNITMGELGRIIADQIVKALRERPDWPVFAPQGDERAGDATTPACTGLWPCAEHGGSWPPPRPGTHESELTHIRGFNLDDDMQRDWWEYKAAFAWSQSHKESE